MLRASSYNIYVDLPGESGEMVLVHGYSGAYDKVSRRVATYIRSLEVGRPPRPLFGQWTPEPPIEGEVTRPSEAAISTLERRGYLTSMSVEEEEAYFTKLAGMLHQQASRTPSYIFMPTYDCNLRCGYCFQDHMRTDPSFRHLLRTMRRSLVDRIFEAIPTIEAHHGLEATVVGRRSIGLFGGEPLLARSRRIVEYILAKTRALGGATVWAVTNATELDAYRDLLGPGLIEQLQITLDGPKAEHDKRRIYADGGPSFARVADHISMALELGASVSVRMNVDRNNIHQLPELADEIRTRGWSAYSTFAAYAAPIHAANNHTSIKQTYSTWELDRALTHMRVDDSRMLVIDRPDDRITDQVMRIFHQKAEPSLRATFCGAHSGMYIFDCFGDIYACWERTGDAKLRIGSVTEDGSVALDERNNKLWRSRNVSTNAICRKCRYASYCGGGCAVLAEAQRGEFFTNYCDGFAARFRASAAEAFLRHAAGDAGADKVEWACDL